MGPGCAPGPPRAPRRAQGTLRGGGAAHLVKPLGHRVRCAPALAALAQLGCHHPWGRREEGSQSGAPERGQCNGTCARARGSHPPLWGRLYRGAGGTRVSVTPSLSCHPRAAWCTCFRSNSRTPEAPRLSSIRAQFTFLTLKPALRPRAVPRPKRHRAALTLTAAALHEEADEVQQGQCPVLLVRLDPLLHSCLGATTSGEHASVRTGRARTSTSTCVCVIRHMGQARGSRDVHTSVQSGTWDGPGRARMCTRVGNQASAWA